MPAANRPIANRRRCTAKYSRFSNSCSHLHHRKARNIMSRKKNNPDELLIGLVSISDRASSGQYQDQGIPALQEWFASALTSPRHFEQRLVPDERPAIEQALIELADVAQCDLIVTTGGTG